MTDCPLVSILIVTWNRKDDLLKCIASAREQTWPNIEIVVVDNASTDGTAEAVAEAYPDVRIVRSHVNLGCPSGRNLGIVNCRGKYIYSLDDDGWLDEKAVELSVARMEADESVAVAMSRVHEMDGERLVRRRPEGVDEMRYTASFSGGCSTMRRSALEAAGLFPDDFFRQGEEADLALRLLDRGYLIVCEPASVMYHRPSSVGRNPVKFHYFHLRNTMKTGLRLWPFPWLLFRIFTNFWRATVFALTRGAVHFPLLLFWVTVGEMCHPSRREPVSHETIKLFRRLRKAPAAERPTLAGSQPTVGSDESNSTLRAKITR